jgi:hypothetical protein
MTRLRDFLIEVCALLSSVGGPLFLFDRVKGQLGDKPAFALAFLPIVLMVLGALSLKDEPGERLARLAVRAGMVGAFFLTAVNLWAACLLAAGAPCKERGLIVVGIAVGLIGACAYIREALPFLRELERPPTSM